MACGCLYWGENLADEGYLDVARAEVKKVGKKKREKKIPRGRKDDSIRDLDQDGMLGSEGWRGHKEKEED